MTAKKEPKTCPDCGQQHQNKRQLYCRACRGQASQRLVEEAKKVRDKQAARAAASLKVSDKPQMAGITFAYDTERKETSISRDGQRVGSIYKDSSPSPRRYYISTHDGHKILYRRSLKEAKAWAQMFWSQARQKKEVL